MNLKFFSRSAIFLFITFFIFNNQLESNNSKLNIIDGFKVITFALGLERIVLDGVLYKYGLGIEEKEKVHKYNFDNINFSNIFKFEEQFGFLNKALKDLVGKNIIGGELSKWSRNFFKSSIFEIKSEENNLFEKVFGKSDKVFSLLKSLYSNFQDDFKILKNNTNCEIAAATVLGATKFAATSYASKIAVDYSFKKLDIQCNKNESYNIKNLSKDLCNLILKHNIIVPIISFCIAKSCLMNKCCKLEENNNDKNDKDLNDKYNDLAKISEVSSITTDLLYTALTF